MNDPKWAIRGESDGATLLILNGIGFRFSADGWAKFVDYAHARETGDQE